MDIGICVMMFELARGRGGIRRGAAVKVMEANKLAKKNFVRV